MTRHYAPQPRPACPNCTGRHVARQGHSAAGKERWRCKRCGTAFAIAVLAERPAKVASNFPDEIRVAQPVTIPGFRYGSSRLG